MALVGIRVVSAKDSAQGRPRLWQIALRLLLYVPSLHLFGAALLDDHRRALHDCLARTRVISSAG